MDRRKLKAQSTRKKSLIAGMEDAEALNAFESLAESLGILVRYEAGDFHGGLCSLEAQKIILLRKDNPDFKNITILARELSMFDLDHVYVLPALRRFIEDVRDDVFMVHSAPPEDV